MNNVWITVNVLNWKLLSNFCVCTRKGENRLCDITIIENKKCPIKHNFLLLWNFFSLLLFGAKYGREAADDEDGRDEEPLDEQQDEGEQHGSLVAKSS